MTSAEGKGQIRHFDANFKLQEMQLFGGKIDVVDIAPEVPHPDKPIPVLFAPGWSANPLANKGPLRVLSEQGRRVISLSHMRHGGRVRRSFKEYKEIVDQRLQGSDISEADREGQIAEMNRRWGLAYDIFPNPTLRRALTLLALLEEKGVEKADLVGHSEGVIDAVVAKFIAPDKVGNIVGIESGGIMGEDSMIRIGLGNMRQAKLEAKHNDPLPYDESNLELVRGIEQIEADSLTPQEGKENVKKYFNSNRKRAIAEVRALAKSPIDLLLQMARLDGSGVALIHAEGDPVFPLERVKRRGKIIHDSFNSYGELDLGSVDYFETVGGTHSTIFSDPRIMKLADHYLTRLANDQKVAAE